MLIGLNGQYLSKPNPAGPEKYTINLYQGLSNVDQENKYFVLVDNKNLNIYDYLNLRPNFILQYVSPFLSWTQCGLPSYLFAHPLDVFFTPIHTLPLLRPSRTKYVSMVHGLEYKFKKPTNLVQKLLWGKPEEYVCKNSHALVVPSLATKSEVLATSWTGEDKITVIPEGVSDSFYKRNDTEISQVRNKYNLGHSDYLIFIGTIQPRKNLIKTFEGFAEFLKNTKYKDLKLVVVGKKGWEYQNIVNYPNTLGIQENVTFVGRVPDIDLPPLISGARAMINLSPEEGFGLPVLESMACETPCILSDIPSYKEFGEKSALFCSPTNVDGIARVIAEGLANNTNEMVRLAKSVSSHYTWNETAKKTLTVFQKLV